MNKIFVLIIIIFFSSENLYSQNENSDSNFNVGINLGPNYTNIRGGSFTEEFSSKISYFIGLKLEYNITEKISVIANLNYDSKYLKDDFVQIRPSAFSTEPFIPQELIIDDQLKLKYLNIPVLVRYYLGSKNNYFINLGGFFNNLLNAKYIRNDDQYYLGYFNKDSSDYIKSSDFGISFGLGTKFNFENKTFLEIEIRNDTGFNEIQEDKLLGVKPFKVNTLRLNINWSFEL